MRGMCARARMLVLLRLVQPDSSPGVPPWGLYDLCGRLKMLPMHGEKLAADINTRTFPRTAVAEHPKAPSAYYCYTKAWHIARASYCRRSNRCTHLQTPVQWTPWHSTPWKGHLHPFISVDLLWQSSSCSNKTYQSCMRAKAHARACMQADDAAGNIFQCKKGRRTLQSGDGMDGDGA